MPFLEIKGLTYTYPGESRPALVDVDLTADRGSLVAIVGPNASGKSTLAKTIKGLVPHDGGEINLDGRPVRGGSPDRRVGFLLPNPENQLVTSIVEEDVAFGLETLGTAPAEIRSVVDRTLETLGIAHLRRSMPHRLSGGEQQMIALAGALAPDPDILILDEPTTYLDPRGRRLVLGALAEVVQRGKTVLLITHDMEEAAQADRVALIRDGRIECVSKPSEFFKDRKMLDSASLRQPFSVRLSHMLEAEGMDPLVNSLRLDVLISGLIEMVGQPGVISMPADRLEENKGGSGAPAALEFDDVGFQYTGGTPQGGNVLDGLDLRIPKGCFSILCGANGAGKSTLLQLTNGLLEPNRGRVLVNGRTMNEIRSSNGGVPSQVALLFQNPERQVFSDTVYDDIAFGPRNLGKTDKEVHRLVTEAVGWVGLPDEVLQRSPFRLSGGQLRRTAVAGVIAMASDVLVLDEPTDGLDPAGAEEFMARVGDYISRTGSTVLMATHRVPEMISGVHFLAGLEKGHLTGSGAPSEILFSQDSPLDREFLPSHIRLQLALLRNGIGIESPSLDPAEAAAAVVDAVKRARKQGGE
jgi:energy-coupling factor transport system ATP-binding protein